MLQATSSHSVVIGAIVGDIVIRSSADGLSDAELRVRAGTGTGLGYIDYVARQRCVLYPDAVQKKIFLSW